MVVNISLFCFRHTVFDQSVDRRRSLKLAEAEVAVKEAPTAAAESYATGFWPETGAVAAVSAGFLIQVRASR